MTVKEFKKFILTLPSKFDDYVVVNRIVEEEYMYDNPIFFTYIDEENESLALLDEENSNKIHGEEKADSDDNTEDLK